MLRNKLLLEKKVSVNMLNDDAEDDPEKIKEVQAKLDEERCTALSNNAMLRSDTVYILMNIMWKTCLMELQQRMNE